MIIATEAATPTSGPNRAALEAAFGKALSPTVSSTTTVVCEASPLVRATVLEEVRGVSAPAKPAAVVPGEEVAALALVWEVDDDVGGELEVVVVLPLEVDADAAEVEELEEVED